jgi:hypothetical protein
MKEACCNCGIIFDLPDHICNQRKIDGKLFYCPNGHGQHYTENKDVEIQRLKSQIADLQARITDLCKDKAELCRRISAFWYGNNPNEKKQNLSKS